MGAQGLNLDLDKQGRPKVQFPLQASLGGGMPPVAPVLPSLSKPIQQQAQPITAGAIPPVSASAPSPEEQQVTQARANLDKVQSSPPASQGLWNKAGEYHKEHPGFLGRIAQVGAGILRGVDIAGESIMPGAARMIPGSIVNHNQQIAAGQRELGEAEKQFTPVRTEEMAGKRLDQQQSIQDQKEAQQTSIETQKEAARATQQTEAEAARHTEDEANRQASDERLNKTLTAGNERQDKTIAHSDAAQRALFAQQEKLLRERGAGAQDKTFTGKDVMVTKPDGSRMVMPYGEAQKQGIPSGYMAAVPAAESQKLHDQSASAASTVTSFKRYQDHMTQLAPQLNSADRTALGVLTAPDKVAGGFWHELQAGSIDTLLQQPLTGYSSKLMSSAMTKDQYDKMSPAGKQLLADYYNAIIANFANMKNILGSIGRNELQLQAEIHTIPLPYLDSATAGAMFSDKMQDVTGRNKSIPGMFGQQPEGGNNGRRVIDLTQ